MLSFCDRLAAGWLFWRRCRASQIDPALARFDIDSVTMEQDTMQLMRHAPAVAIFAEQAAALLNAHKADHYVSFDMLGAGAAPLRGIRLTVQWASGESPAQQNVRLKAQLAACEAQRDTLQAAVGHLSPEEPTP